MIGAVHKKTPTFAGVHVAKVRLFVGYFRLNHSKNCCAVVAGRFYRRPFVSRVVAILGVIGRDNEPIEFPIALLGPDLVIDSALGTHTL